MNKSGKVLLLKAELIAVVIGAFAGIVSRLLLVGNTPNSEILPSWWGLMAFLVIAYGLSGLLFGLQHKILLILPRTAVLVAGIMWVIPLPI